MWFGGGWGVLGCFHGPGALIRGFDIKPKTRSQANLASMPYWKCNYQCQIKMYY